MAHAIDTNSILLIVSIAVAVWSVGVVVMAIWWFERSEAAKQVALTAAFADALHYLGSRRRGDTADAGGTAHVRATRRTEA